jgi:hypothetical protein
MRSSTVNLTIYGDDYSELVFNSELALSEFFKIDKEELIHYANYELIILENLEMGSDSSYVAELIAKVKNDRK